MFGRLFGRRRRTLPYGMFQLADYGLEARNARVLERIYHKGHRLAWDGKEVLGSLIDKHGLPQMDPKTKAALGRVFAVIMWGELAAWRISAELADELEPLEAKMAATSQAFDEARHFYVMHDYLVAIDALPKRVTPGAQRLLESVMNADHLAKKLIGMQLMVEPVALTLFHIVRKMKLEPVLTDLLPYFERDEARHVALGVQYLPAMLTQMSVAERVDFFLFQFRLITLEILSSKSIIDDLGIIGVDPRELVEVGRAKQMSALAEMWKELPGGVDLPGEILTRYGDSMVELLLMQDRPVRSRVAHAWKAVTEGVKTDEKITIDPDLDDDATPLIRGLGRRRKARA